MTLEEIKLLPSVALKDRNELPAGSGIYFVVSGDAVLYIGRSKRLRQRWHRQRGALNAYANVYIHWLKTPNMGWQYCKLESKLIHAFEPPLNGTMTRHRISDNESTIAA